MAGRAKRVPHWREVESDLREIICLVSGADTSIPREGKRRRIRYPPLLGEFKWAHGAAYDLASGSEIKVRSGLSDPTGRAVEDYRDEDGKRQTDRERAKQAIRTAGMQVGTALDALRAAHEVLRLNVGRGTFTSAPYEGHRKISKDERQESYDMKRERQKAGRDWGEA